jgi:hypothetical protein
MPTQRPCVGGGFGTQAYRDLRYPFWFRSKRNRPSFRQFSGQSAKSTTGRTAMGDIIYLVGLVVVIMAILSFFGLR